MSNLFLERTPFDILVRNFLSQQGSYAPVERNTKSISHPVDIYTVEAGLNIDIACTGIDKKDIEILTEKNVLRVNYDKKESTEDKDYREYVFQGIAKRSFNLGWKIDSKFDLSKAEATFDNGLLTVAIPFAESAKPKTLKIK